jgi:hypothetical protein
MKWRLIIPISARSPIVKKDLSPFSGVISLSRFTQEFPGAFAERSFSLAHTPGESARTGERGDNGDFLYMPIKKNAHSISLIAESVGYKALKALMGSKRVKVHSVFDHAFYIQPSSNSLINVIKNENYISPTSILIKDFGSKSFKTIGVAEGMRAKFDKHALIFGNDALAIKFGKSSNQAPHSFPKHPYISPTGISLNLRILRDVIYTSPTREGLVPLLENVELHGPLQFFLQPQKPTFSETARPHIDMLMRGLFGCDSYMVINGALSILGLGPGLTPSCDDFLMGLILSLNLGGKALLKDRRKQLSFYQRVSDEIRRAAKGKTTIYSQTLLDQARRGEGPKAVIELVHSLLTKDPSWVAAVSKTVIEMGETSGADIAIGVYYGIRFLVSQMERIEDLIDETI